MSEIRIGHLAIGSYKDALPKSLWIQLGPLTLFFSYETCVAFDVGQARVFISENLWSTTTGRHITEIEQQYGQSKKDRIRRADFEMLLQEALEKRLT